jgi:hypothetical protein
MLALLLAVVEKRFVRHDVLNAGGAYDCDYLLYCHD